MRRPKQAPRSPVHDPPTPGSTPSRPLGPWRPRDASSSEPNPLESPGKPLEAATRTLMESRLGHDFSRIRVHTDREASESARTLGARAYAAGIHLVFREGAYAPGTHEGQRLIAHELTHSIQQGGNAGHLRTDSPPPPADDRAEQEARSVAHGFLEQPAFSITPGSLHRIGRNGEGIREWAQRAGKEIEQEIIWKLAQEILDEILTPALHKASVIARINQYSPGVSATAVRALGQRSLEDIAGSDAGPQILNTLLLKLAGTPEATAVAKALDARSSSKTAIPVAPASPESITALERMNRVLGSDPRFGEYARADIPLKFPVQLYSAGRAVDGGVYYDPNLESTGLVPIKGTRAGVGGQISRLQYPLLFIKLGPPALASSDAYLQSTLWHEFSHYRRALEFRKPDKDKSEAVKLLEAAVGPEGEGQDPDNETEATSIQLADYHASLTDEDVKSTLLYLARFIKKANAPFKPDAIKRIRDAVAGTPAQRLRLIRLIDGLKNTERRNNLSDLRSALAK